MGRQLVVQAAQHSAARAAVVVLDQLHRLLAVVAQKLMPLATVPAFKEKASVIIKDPWVEQ
jgi:hypothetical protein